MSSDPFISHLLEEAADRLTKELLILGNTHSNLNLTITHNDVDELLVYAPRSVKAYLPKMYDGWKVTFTESPNGKIIVDLDQQLDFQI